MRNAVIEREHRTLFGDPLTFIASAVSLFAVALAGCYFPARAASRVDPISALRAECPRHRSSVFFVSGSVKISAARASYVGNGAADAIGTRGAAAKIPGATPATRSYRGCSAAIICDGHHGVKGFEPLWQARELAPPKSKL